MATVRVAFWDLVAPKLLEATHQYVPASLSLLVVTTRKKKSDPDGRSTRWERGSWDEVVTSSPSLNHVMRAPLAAQLRVAGSLRRATTLLGCSLMTGGAPAEERERLLLKLSRGNVIGEFSS